MGQSLQVVVSGTAVGEMALHFLEKYGIMVLRLPSKFELMRFCRATSATARATFGAPQPEELGFAKWLSVQVRKACMTRMSGLRLNRMGHLGEGPGLDSCPRFIDS
jgi:chaperonin GroEL (HSP60 family)